MDEFTPQHGITPRATVARIFEALQLMHRDQVPILGEHLTPVEVMDLCISHERLRREVRRLGERVASLENIGDWEMVDFGSVSSVDKIVDNSGEVKND